MIDLLKINHLIQSYFLIIEDLYKAFNLIQHYNFEKISNNLLQDFLIVMIINEYYILNKIEKIYEFDNLII